MDLNLPRNGHINRLTHGSTDLQTATNLKIIRIKDERE